MTPEQAIAQVGRWTEQLAELPPPGEDDGVGFSHATDGVMREYLSRLMSGEDIPLKHHLAAASYLRTHSNTQIPRGPWQEAYRTLLAAYQRESQRDPQRGPRVTAEDVEREYQPRSKATPLEEQLRESLRDSFDPDKQITGDSSKGTAGRQGSWVFNNGVLALRNTPKSRALSSDVFRGKFPGGAVRWAPVDGTYEIRVQPGAIAAFTDHVEAQGWKVLAAALREHLDVWLAEAEALKPAGASRPVASAPFTGTAASGSTDRGLRWEWNAEDPDTLLLQIPFGLAQELPTSQGIRRDGVFWNAYRIDDVKQLHTDLLQAGAGALASAVEKFIPEWTARAAVDDESMQRARNLWRRFQYMVHPDVRRDPEKAQALLEKVAVLLSRVKPGDWACDLGAFGRWCVTPERNGTLNRKSSLHVYMPYNLRSWSAGLRHVKKEKDSTGTWNDTIPLAKVPETARALDLVSPPLALSLRIAFLTEVLRECPELEELAGAVSVQEIADPRVRGLAEEYIARMYACLAPGTKLYPYQEVGAAFVHFAGNRALIGDGMGLGKAQPLSAKVMTPSGWRTMAELRIGDVVSDPDGGVGTVEGIFPQGEMDIYRVTTADGLSTECTEDHLWHVQTPHDRHRGSEGRVLPLKDFKDRLFQVSGSVKNRRCFLPVAAPVEFSAVPALPLDPWLLGILLGNGGLSQSTPTLSTVEEWIVERVRSLLADLGVSMERMDAGLGDYRLSAGSGFKENPLTRILRDLGLYGHLSVEKFIPPDYLRASVEDRLELLRGLMDTDGDCTKEGTSVFNTSSERLLQDTRGLVGSLGGFGSVYTKPEPKYTHRGEVRTGAPAYRLNIRLPVNPFSLPRKAERWHKPYMARGIDKVEPVGRAECQCIRVSTKRHLYITDGYLVTHNTLQALAVLSTDAPTLTPALVVAPASVTHNWKREGERWTPRLRFHVIDSHTDLRKLGRGDVAILSYGSLSNLFERLQRVPWQTFVADECFPGEATILTARGEVPIKDVVVGDSVWSCDTTTGILCWAPVQQTYARPQKTHLVRITHEHGTLVATHNHKVWTVERGYVEAGSLGGLHLRVLRGNRTEEAGWATPEVLQQELFHACEAGGPSQNGGGTPGKASSGFGEAHAGEQSHGLGGNTIEDGGNEAGARSGPGEAWGERPWHDGASAPSGRSDRDGGGVHPAHEIRPRAVRPSSEPFQAGPRGSGRNGGGRGGWGNASEYQRKGTGYPEGEGAVRSRVVRVEVLEQGGVGESASGPGADHGSQTPLLYDLEVAGTHCYFAEGVLVSNSHFLKNPGAGRTKTAIELSGNIPHRLLLSGTAMENRPAEMWSQLNIIAPEVFPDSKDFAKRFGSTTKRRVGAIDYDDDRAAQDDVDHEGEGSGLPSGVMLILAELRETLRCFMVRRLKQEVLTDLPEKTRQYLWNPLPPKLRARYDDIFRNMAIWMEQSWHRRAVAAAVRLVRLGKANVQEAVDEINLDSGPPKGDSGILVALGHLRRLIGEAKAQVAVDWLETFLAEGDEPILVAFDHQKPLKVVKDALTKMGVSWTVIDGSVPPHERQKRVADFQAGKYRVFLGTRAMAEGVTLTRAATVLFVERWWVPSKEEQMEDRTHRIGQKNNVLVLYLMAPDTIDDHIAMLVDEKRRIIEAVMRGEDVSGQKFSGGESGGMMKALMEAIRAASGDEGYHITVAEVEAALREGTEPEPAALDEAQLSALLDQEDAPGAELAQAFLAWALQAEGLSPRVRQIIQHPAAWPAIQELAAEAAESD